MLTSVTVDSFRCLQGLQVSLRPLTVLVGANDSGKSSFLAALRWLAQPNASSLLDVPRRAPDGTIRVAVVEDGQQADLQVRFGPGPQFHSDSGRQLAAQAVGFFRPQPSGVPTQSVGTPGLPELSETGDGVAALLDHLLRHDRDRFFQIEAALRDLVPGVQRINIATPDPSQRAIELELERGLKLPATSLSTGVRLMLFFVALAFHPQPPKVLLIEEPETGVHPRRLGDIVRLLREVTEGKYGGRPAQVVLTTHSPYLLDHVDPATDQVLVFRREADGRRTARPVPPDRLKSFQGEFLLGEVWFNEGEDGLVRAAP